MNSRERVQRAVRREKPDRVPRDLWVLPGVSEGRKAEYEAHLRRYPVDIGTCSWRPGSTGRESGVRYRTGRYRDYWGVTFEAAEDGVIGEVKDPVMADWNNLDGFTVPWAFLKEADWSKVDSSCRASDKFILANTEARPFERLQFLRGTENVFMDLAAGSPELMELLKKIHEWEQASVEMWSRTAVDGISFMDDWGTQTALLISPALWREIFKPLYRRYCEMAHARGKLVFFHSDGNTAEIYGDLIEIGVDAVNSQLFCMDIEELARKHKGRITLWGELDRQHLQPFGTPEKIRAAVRRVRKAFDTGNGGLIAQTEWGRIDPYPNIEALYEEWDRPFVA